MSRGREQQRAAERRVVQLLHGRATRTHIREIHAHLLRRHLHFSNLLLAHLVSVCASLRRVPYAHRLFLSHPSPSLPLFNATLKALSLSAGPDALRLFSLLRCRALYPDRLSFAPLLKAASFFPVTIGRSVHALTLVSGFASHPPIAIGILEIYTSSGEMDSAHRAFDEMTHKEVVAYNMMINGYCKGGDFENGFRLFRRMDERSIVTWNSMIVGLVRCNRDGEALKLFREMWDYYGFEPGRSPRLPSPRAGPVHLIRRLSPPWPSSAFLLPPPLRLPLPLLPSGRGDPTDGAPHCHASSSFRFFFNFLNRAWVEPVSDRA